jgi:uncharacterized repeat protein (TIGR03806 family)
MQSSSIVSWIACVCALSAAPLLAQEKNDPPLFECRWAEGPIEIDGQPTDADWQHAQVIDKFGQPWLKENARPAKTSTKARLLWDRQYLYFFADLEDHDLFADITEHDGRIWNNDVFELFFRPAEDKPGYYEFQINPAGTTLDIFFPRRGGSSFDERKSDGEFLWKTAVNRRGTLNNRTDRDEGWSVEGRIPWTDLMRTGGRPAVGETWRFALCRYDYTLNQEPELSTCAPLTRPSFHALDDYARLKFRGMETNPRKPPAIKERVPLKASKVIGSPDPPLPYRPVRAFPQLELTYPIALDRIPGTDDLLIIAQGKSYGATTIYLIKDDPDVATAETILETPSSGTAYGICFHPKFADNGYFYVGWNGRLEGASEKQTLVTRYVWDRNKRRIDDSAPAVNIISWESNGHNGGDMEFGLDGMLYVTSGDGTSDSDTNMRGQDLTKLTAKVLRIDADHPAQGKNYSVPADNPFIGQQNIVPETWAYGLRNPWRITVDPLTGHVWVAQNGQDLWEQVYLVRKGDNFGWSVYEGSHIFYANRQLGPHPHVLPTAEHHHSEARSLTGGVVYHGQKLPDLRGAYIYGDHSTGRIWGIKHDGTKVNWHKLLADTTFNITGFGLDSHGELLVADHRADGEGAFYYLENAPPVAAPSTFPRKLSESGLFATAGDRILTRRASEGVSIHVMQPGVIPYSVNSPLWSDGAHKERYLAIPHKDGVDSRIEMTPKWGWNFPDETVLIKSFALETKEGDPTTRRWIETRFLTKQQGEWVGYSYLWNDEQTDAELVPAEGADREYEIRVPPSTEHPDGLKKQKWRYPSRTECMVCHSRAANFVLGLSTLQMNKPHDYGGVIDEQLRVLEHLGMLKANYEQDAVRFLKDDLRKEGREDKDVNRLAAERSAKSDQRSPPTTSLLAGPPSRYPHLPDPYNENEPLEARARSYLHANCAICHIGAGGGNSQIELDYTASLSRTKMIDAVPLHHKFGLKDARIIAPGHPERSVLLHRLAHRGEGSGQMPQLATNLIDEAAVKLFENWIRSMQP